MPTTVQPSTFQIVDFDAGRIADLTDELARKVGLGEGVDSVDPVHIRTESGSLEDPKKVRKFSQDSATDVLGRYLLRVADRRQPGFADAPPDDDLTVPQRTAWDVYAVGRLARLGYAVRRQRWLYAFRNRHGFTDDADGAFEQLWGGEGLGWAEIDRLSETSAATNPGPLNR
jgi:hypothetical protein